MRGKIRQTAWILGLVVAAAGVVHAQTDCRDRLDLTTAYECEIRDEAGGSSQGTVEFADVDGVLFTSTLTLDGGGTPVVTTGVCSCRSRGSLAAPQFAAALDWHCVSDLGAGQAEVLAGKTTGNGRKLKQVELFSVDQAVPQALWLRMECEAAKGAGPGSAGPGSGGPGAGPGNGNPNDPDDGNGKGKGKGKGKGNGNGGGNGKGKGGGGD
ncbi:MAG: hypothetical protein R3325_01785 [Thermoanaerobaculia bacterium]|nr:hypothetical protein [Thermoanaerobaculia bacterium]